MVNNSTKARQASKCKKYMTMMPVSSALMNKQREYDSDARKLEYMRGHSAPVPKKHVLPV